MISRKEIKLGLIGAGGIAQTWSTAIKAMTAVELVVVADMNLEAASRLAVEHDAKAVSTLEDLESVEFDALIVCTPPFFSPGALQYVSQEGCSRAMREAIGDRFRKRQRYDSVCQRK